MQHHYFMHSSYLRKKQYNGRGDRKEKLSVL
jgi:hypothetical protein